MRKLIVLRVGEYNPTDETLTDLGRRQFRAVSERIRDQVAGLRVVLMSSVAPRALACAAIIGEILGIEFERHREFFSDVRNPPDLRGGLKLVEERGAAADVIVLVTHYDFVGQFPAHFAFVRGFVAHSWSIEKASAWMLNCENHELVHIRPS